MITKEELDTLKWDLNTRMIEDEFPGYIDKLKISLSFGELYKIEKDKKILTLFGCIEYLKDHYFVFIVPTVYTKTYGFYIARNIKKILNDFVRNRNASRIGTESLDDKVMNRWHEWLGFKCEGIKENYIGNRNYKIWRLQWQRD